MQGNGSIELFQYWNRLRNRRAAPQRSEVEPADIKTLLADTFILEQDMRGEAIFRLAGTRLCNVHGRELKGFPFSSLWRHRDRRLASRMVKGVFEDRAVVIIAYQGVSQKGRSANFELLLLPLDGGQRTPRCLGIATPAEMPFWMGADPVVENRLESVRIVDPDREPMFLKNRPAVTVPRLAPEKEEVSPAPRAPRGRRVGHLLVFDGGRGGQS